MDKYLIINCDDFGMCHAANAATFDLLERGGVTSATIMTPCGWAPEAVEWAKNHPQYAIGIHITYTSEWGKYRWRPVSHGNNESLRDADGYMHKHNEGVWANAKLPELAQEARAQVDFALNMGFAPSHLDNHMGSAYTPEILPEIFKICAEHGYPFRIPCKSVPGDDVPPEFAKQIIAGAKLADGMGIATLDYLWTHHWDKENSRSYEDFHDYMFEHFKHCPDGFVETYIHPSLECDELKNTSSVWIRRVWEHRFFADPETRKYIESLGIKYIDYRDLKKMRGY